ncbi:MAG: DUF3179 domain-containing protein [bacterium]|nr:DUF3179 domain-containing protein [bacterium]
MKYSTFILILSLPLFFSCSHEDETPSAPINNVISSAGIIEDEINSTSVIIYGDERRDILIAFNRRLQDGTLLDFEMVISKFPVVLVDQEGTEWDIFGNAISGPRSGESLIPLHAVKGFWFSLSSMYAEVTLFNEDSKSILPSDGEDPEWLVNPEMVFRSTFKDAIRSLDNPTFQSFSKKDLIDNIDLSDEDLVILNKINDEIYIYPINVLNWHEIVNHTVGNTTFTVSHCPLTATSFIDRVTSERFGVSGLLYNNNLVMYDQETETYWSQILNKGIHGELMGASFDRTNIVETNWETAKSLVIEDATILSFETGFDQDYSQYPYGDYRENQDRISYPLTFYDMRLPYKEIVLGIEVNGSVKVYRYEHFEQ